eukprot:CAMPEP_0168289646 /NCGR_PEP_ID=MMETSP0142_2-20121227/4560_1 /TAXON_ID=44445 /ORGANISM="Pseudo-nitzschia australis, Strain 10249 10 AB" /LENGTH=528 /DNA_ID=CAMNT_0008236339 /DNA_START=616 /DNA_END=2202 /DNA_ORIENTATION=-
MKSSRTLESKDCRVEGYDDNDGSVQASINGNLEIPSGSADCVASLASSSTEKSPKNGLSIRISGYESSTVIQQGTGGNSLGEKRKSSSLNGSSSRHKSSSLLPSLLTIPSSRQGQNEEQNAQQQQHQPAIMYLRDLMFKSDLLGRIPNLDKDGKTCKDEDEDDNNLMVGDIISEYKDTDLFYDAEEGAVWMLSSKDAGNTKGNQDQEGRKRIVRFALDQGSPELIEEDQRLLAHSMQGSLCAFDIYNESDGGLYDIEKYGGTCSAKINNFYREMYDDKDEASSCEYYSGKDEDDEKPKNKSAQGMFYSMVGIAFAGATVISRNLFSAVRKSKDDNFGGREVISQGTQNTVDTVHLVESSTRITQSSSSLLQSSSSAFKTSSGMLQSSALNSGASSGASSTSISSSMATSSASSSAASSAGASASSTTASTVSASASSTASSTASTVTSTAASTTASATASATSAVSASASTAVATQAVAVGTQTAILQSMVYSTVGTMGATSAMTATATAGAAAAAISSSTVELCAHF